jgi:hypothetical protein
MNIAPLQSTASLFSPDELATSKPLEDRSPGQNEDAVGLARSWVGSHQHGSSYSIVFTKRGEPPKVVRCSAVGRLDLNDDLWVAQHGVDLDARTRAPTGNL